ncbi:DNA mismatch repair endonuclease MutL [Carnobacteriaceae bacterium zg-ZUI252]|nr:DNA mismatch repair endonuclease MutL [Carnobacteriaceae bacterium zg-ZUI252]QTU83017.1 DNA mismatch repair endonuclease MutL [Carnobacteriaceae bacterium zg-C25]
MGKIIELPVHISNQIKAGEIVERPVSVVKELVENAIDANSTQIDVVIEEGGLSRIQVIDNGDGIDSSDVLIAFERHATSKLTALVEKEHILSPDRMPITTLGFRGEALPSIASVSKVTLTTSTDGVDGAHVVIEGGQVKEHKQAIGRKGTTIDVRDLFYNTPARLKFITSLQAEVSKIADLMNRLALSHADIAFSLTVDGNRLLKTAGNNQLQQTIAGVYHPDVARKMVSIHAENMRFSVGGYACLPEVTRARKNFISVFLNGRYIRNFQLINAVVDGYGSTLMVGRFPIAVLKIEADFELVDVNAHPTKETVRISQEAELIALIKEAIESAMLKTTRIPQSVPKRFEDKGEQTQLAFDTRDFASKNQETTVPTHTSVSRDLPFFDERQLDNVPFDNAVNDQPFASGTLHETDSLFTTEHANDTHSKAGDNEQSKYDVEINDIPDAYRFGESYSEPSQVESRRHDEQIQSNGFPELHYFGQMHGTYLFAENANGLYIVDQHAAQERIKYEFYRVAIGQVGHDVQTLLVPIVLDYPVNEYLAISEKMDVLNEIGIHLEPFGQNSYLLEAHPTWIKEDVESTIRELIAIALEDGKVSVAKFRENVAIMMSCKKSIKANHHLDAYQARALLAELSQCENPYNCPHGRPVLVHLTNRDMEKLFKRIV